MQNHVVELAVGMVGGTALLRLQDTTRDPYDSTDGERTNRRYRRAVKSR